MSEVFGPWYWSWPIFECQSGSGEANLWRRVWQLVRQKSVRETKSAILVLVLLLVLRPRSNPGGNEDEDEDEHEMVRFMVC